MSLMARYSKSKLIKRFLAIGPYLREEQCDNQRYFFDCLSVCVNAKSAPEKREFWGWWLVLQLRDNGLHYQYSTGLYNKEGVWKTCIIKESDVQEKITHSQDEFHRRLDELCASLELPLFPAEQPDDQRIKVSA